MTMERYGYVYKTVNLLNGKIYIGQKMTRAFNEHYFGSGIRLAPALRHFGKHNFSVRLLKWARSKESLNDLEEFFVSEYRRRFGSRRLYNIAPGGTGSGPRSKETKEKLRMTFLGPKNHFFGKHHSEKAREANRLAHLGHRHTKETCRKMSRLRRGPLNHFFGKHHSSETRKKLSTAFRGKTPWISGKHHTEATKAKMRTAKIGYVSPNKGKKLPPEWCKNIGLSHLGQKPWNKGKKISKKTRNLVRQKAIEQWERHRAEGYHRSKKHIAALQSGLKRYWEGVRHGN
jgi:hypothetical protein